MALVPHKQPFCTGSLIHPNCLEDKIFCTLSLHPPFKVLEARRHMGIEVAARETRNILSLMLFV